MSATTLAIVMLAVGATTAGASLAHLLRRKASDWETKDRGGFGLGG